jgi:hypothetical protein
MNPHVQTIIRFAHLLEEFDRKYCAKKPRIVISCSSGLPGPIVHFLSVEEAKESLGPDWKYDRLDQTKSGSFITFFKLVEGVRCIFTLDQSYAGGELAEATLPAHAESGTPEAFALARAAHHPESEGAD